MTRVVRSSPNETEWRAVSATNPCPICGASEGPCSGNFDESFVSCSSCPSDWLLTNGAWLHPLPVRLVRTASEEEPPLEDQLPLIGRSLAGTGA